MKKRSRLQRLMLGALFGAIAGLLDRKVRKRLAPPGQAPGHIEASDKP